MIIEFYECWKDAAPKVQLSLPAQRSLLALWQALARLFGCTWWRFRPLPPPLLDGAIHCDDVDGLASGGCL